ncbi:MAG: tryptophan synthase subunit alpha [Planctomycetes bacterium]|nr:tryptophan synthase subunit alpha [Planctomycetota bacterium]
MSLDAINAAFDAAGREARKALVPFLMSGHPTPDQFARNLAEAGKYADVIEVGVPFSDPLADGPVIQAAAAEALKHGTTLASTLAAIAAREDGPPILLMLSCNQLLAHGLERVARRIVEAGASGAIVPDLPFEESTELREIFARHGLVLIAMLAPTTDAARKSAILRQAQGFAYLISVAGVTGARDAFPPETLDYIREAAQASSAPVCVGFGISKPQHVEQLREHADGFIVGSALIRAIESGGSVADVLAPLRQACDATITTGTDS